MYPSPSLSSLLKWIERIRSLSIYEQLESSEKPPWEHFQKHFLLSIRIQKMYQQLFQFFQGIQNIKTRDVLMAYGIVYYDLSDDVKPMALTLVQTLHVEPLELNYRSKLYQALHHYERCYVPWKIDDRTKLLEQLAHMYWEYEVNFRLYESKLTVSEKTYFEDEKKKKQKECLDWMNKIDHLSYFHQYQPVFVDSQASDILLQTLRKAFWDRMTTDLKSTPPKYDGLMAIFQENKEHLQHIGRVHSSIQTEIDELLDVDFLQQRLTDPSLSLEFWKPRILACLNWLIQLDSFEREASHRSKLKELEEHPSLETYMEGLAYFTTRLLEIRQMVDHVFQNLNSAL